MRSASDSEDFTVVQSEIARHGPLQSPAPGCRKGNLCACAKPMGQPANGEPSSPAPPTSLKDAKHEALRKAGADYFERVLEQARKGKNALDEDPRSRRQPKKDLEAQDEDLETVGRALPYALGMLFFAAHSTRLVLAKLALLPLQTPAIQMFLHLLPAVCVTYALIDIGPLTGRTFHHSAVQITLYGCQTLSLFGALNYGSLKLVLAWTTLAPAALACNTSMSQPSSGTGTLRALLVAVGVSGAGIAFLSRLWPSPMSSLCLLGWTAAEAVRLQWEHFKQSPDSSLLRIGGRLREQLISIASEEDNLKHATKAFYSMSISGVLALLTGFICQEGSELVDHELSVPAVSVMLLSCTAWTASAASGLAFFTSVSEKTQRRLTAFTAIAALVFDVAMNGVGNRAGFCAALVAVLGGAGAQQYQH